MAHSCLSRYRKVALAVITNHAQTHCDFGRESIRIYKFQSWRVSIIPGSLN
jgi:hypothetical protein